MTCFARWSLWKTKSIHWAQRRKKRRDVARLHARTHAHTHSHKQIHNLGYFDNIRDSTTRARSHTLEASRAHTHTRNAHTLTPEATHAHTRTQNYTYTHTRTPQWPTHWNMADVWLLLIWFALIIFKSSISLSLSLSLFLSLFLALYIIVWEASKCAHPWAIGGGNQE